MDRATNSKKIHLEEISDSWISNNLSEKKNGFYLFLKRLIDVFFGCTGLILFFIFFPIVAFFIKIESPGHILYKQERVGKNGKKFFLYKFRTMKEDGREYKDIWREKNCENITKVGKILRWTHLDELPQAINILKGNLSFIGPRPEWSELAKIFEKEIPYYKNRYIIKPGIIGWAQINFPASKSVEEAKEKFEYDLYYIKNQSLLLDLEIILKFIKLFFY